MTTETLQWHPAQAGSMPDDDTTVLMWVIDPSLCPDGEWFAGWHDGEVWRDASHGGPVYGTVTHWAEPKGPQC